MLKEICFVTLMIGALGFSGCSIKEGQDFNENYISQIKRGKTTKEEVRSNIGSPTSVTTTSEGESWVYRFTKMGNYFENMSAAFGASSIKNQGKELVVAFRGNIVKDFTFRKGNIAPMGLGK